MQTKINLFYIYIYIYIYIYAHILVCTSLRILNGKNSVILVFVSWHTEWQRGFQMFTCPSLPPCSLLTLEKLTLPEFVKKFLIFKEAEFSLTFSPTPVSARYPEPILSNSSSHSFLQTTAIFRYKIFFFRIQCNCLLQGRNLYIRFSRT